MTNAEFAAKVAELEVLARRDPRDYRVRTVLLGLLGYAYLGAILSLLAAASALALLSVFYLKWAGIKVFIVVAAFLGLLLKALWVRIPAPTGISVTRESAPDLHTLIDDLQRALGAPAFNQVLVTADFNAAVAQVPRFGIFGGSRSYLLLGLPLMKSLSVEQFKAVVAHELGHLARGDAAVATWIYAQRLRWMRLMSVLEETQSRGAFLFKGFINWYAPYFNAYSFPLARAAEFEADAAAAKLTSPRTAADALTAISVVGRFLSLHFWPVIYRQADDHPEPATTPYIGFTQTVRGGLGTVGSDDILAAALADETTIDDTHPALKDRLAAMGEAPRVVLPDADSTADKLLGAQVDHITQALDSDWRRQVLESWQARHKKVQEERSLLADLNRRHEAGEELSVDEANTRAVLTGGVGGDSRSGLEQLRALHERAPDHPHICFNLGVVLLEHDDDGGIPLIERTMALDENAIVEGTKTLRDYCARRGRLAEAQGWHDRLAQRVAELQGAQKERDNITADDKLDPHAIPEAKLTPLREALRAVPELRKAYLARKRVQHLTGRPFYILGFKATRRLLLFRDRTREQRVLHALQHNVLFPGETLIVCLEGENYWLDRKFRFKRGTRIR
jgi:Zn-dependent protease with chaperone function